MFLNIVESDDQQAVFMVQSRAFGYDKEALLALDLLKEQSARPLLSLIAYYNNKAVGHVLFSAAGFEGAPMMHILAPLAVVPEMQNAGIGGQLIAPGLQKLREVGSAAVFVLGHKDYYPKHGFKPHAMASGFLPPFDIKPEHSEYWMYCLLDQERPPAGRLQCARALNQPQHWRDDNAYFINDRPGR